MRIPYPCALGRPLLWIVALWQSSLGLWLYAAGRSGGRPYRHLRDHVPSRPRRQHPGEPQAGVDRAVQPGHAAVNLAGWRFSDGVDFVFPDGDR